MQCKTARFGDGKKYQLQLLGVKKLVWVNQKDLSKDVHKNYDADGSLIKGAKAYVDRGYVTEQKSFLKKKVCLTVLDCLCLRR